MLYTACVKGLWDVYFGCDRGRVKFGVFPQSANEVLIVQVSSIGKKRWRKLF